MRKIITMILMMSAVCAALYANKKTLETAPLAMKGKKEDVKVLPLSKRVQELSVEAASRRIEKETKELDQAKEEYKNVLKKLSEVTEEYNEKAMKGILSPEDERVYEEAAKASLLAYTEYKNAYIKTIRSEEN